MEELVFRIQIEGASTKEAEQLGKLEVQLQRLKKAEKELMDQAAKKKKLTDEERQNLGRIKSQIADVTAVKQRLTKAERDAAKAHTATSGSMNELRAKTAQLRDQLNNLDLTEKKNLDTKRKLQAEITGNTKKIRDFDRSISGSNTLIGEYSRGFTDAFKKIAIGIAAVITVYRTLSRAISGSIKDFAAFEQGQLAVQGLLSQNNATLEQGTLKLMRVYGLEIQDVNKALFDAVSAGVSANESIGFLDTAAKLSKGGVTTLSVAVDGLTSVLNAYGLETSEADKVASAFFSAQKFGKTTVEELANSFGTVAPLAKQMGVSYQEVLSIQAKLTEQGIRTEDATTALKNVFASLISPSKETADTFDRLGIAYGAANVSQEGFLNVFKNVITATENGSAELAELFPNIRALIGAGALTSEAFDDVHRILEVVNNDYGEGSSLSRAFQLQQEGLTEKLNTLKQTFTTLRIEMGERLVPVIDLANKALAFFREKVIGIKDSVRDEGFQLTIVNREIQRQLTLIADQNISQETRKRLIQETNEKYGEYLPQLITEKDTLEDLAIIGEQVNKNMLTKILLIEYEEDLAEIYRKQREQAERIYEAEVKLSDLRRQEEKALQEVNLVDIRTGKAMAGMDPTAVKAGYEQLRAIQEAEIAGGLKVIGDLDNEITTMFGSYERKAQILGTSLEEVLKKGGGAGGGKPIPGGGGKTTTTTDPKEAAKREADLAKAQLDTLREFEAAKVAIIEDAQYKSLAAEILRFDTEAEMMRKRAEEFPELQVEIDALMEVKLLEHEQRKEAIQQQFRDARAKARQDEINAEEQARQKELQMMANKIQLYSNLVNGLADLFEAGKQRELSAAGDNEEKRMAIEKKYARRRQAMQAAQVIMNTAQAYMAALATVQPTIPAGVAAAKWTAVMGAIQLATVFAQKFATGGKVKSGFELPGSSPGQDNTLALVKPREVILNENQQAKAGGPDFFRKLGVPGFATGGMVMPEQDSGASLAQAEVRGFQRVIERYKVFIATNELNKKLKETAIINQTNEL